MIQKRSFVCAIITLICILVTPAISSHAMQSDKTAAPTGKTTTSKAAHQIEDSSTTGTRLFEQHCARCHNAPESFSPRISGTILRHMRVRASLSKQEEKDLLRFFNP